jgi:diguanylate cyclase (GGDEF)-like protein/PAS domain S-box-containing protein
MMTMDDRFLEKIINQMPVGYACHKIICDSQGTPVDYEFLSANASFGEFTGLKPEQIMGKRVLEVIPNIREDEFDWIEAYGNIALNGGRREFEQYSAALNKWYRVIALSPEKYYFITYFMDITKEILQLNEHKMLITALNDIIFELNEDFVFENIISPDEGILFLPKEQIIGQSLPKLFPKKVGETLMAAFKQARKTGIKQTVDYPSIYEGDPRWFRAKIRFLEYRGLKKYLVNIVDISEEKLFEQELIEKTEELNRFFSINLDLLCIADTDGSFVKVNKSWETILGYSQQDLEGKNFLDFIHPDDTEASLVALEKLSHQEAVLNFVNRYRCYDGTYKFIEWRSRPYGHQIYAAARDITEHIQMEEVLFLEKEKYRSTLLSIGDGVISVDKNQKIDFMNQVAYELTGFSEAEAIGQPFEDIFTIVNEKTRKKAVNPVEKVLQEGIIVNLENQTRLIRKDQTEIAIEDSAAPIRDQYHEIQGAVLVFRDVTEKKRIRTEIEYISFHDYLTGLYNRRFFEEEMNRLDTKRNLPISLIMLDVNGLKLTNDAFGHKMGDALLLKVAEIIKANCRNDDILARIGGDEFAVILPKTDALQADLICHRIMEQTEKETLDAIIISVAMGYDTKNYSSQDLHNVLNKAEDVMYQNKIRTSRTMRSQTLQLILETLNQRGEQERLHAQNVSRISRRIGLAMNLLPDQINALDVAGLLHDVGNILIPPEILKQPGGLSPEQYDQVKKHPETGYQILKSVEEYAPFAEYVLCHQEHWDGSGYPRNLEGTAIPLVSRIIHIADAYEVITSGRPYKPALNRNDAIRELEAHAGSQFDPQVLEVFINQVLGREL